jgi:uroporphyrinogen-III synthase
MRVLVTRPDPDGARLAGLLRARGHEPVIQPLLEIAPRPAQTLPVEPLQAILFTSRNAVRAMAAHPELARLRDVPVLCVGAATAQVARTSGFTHVRPIDGTGTAEALAQWIIDRLEPDGGALLFPSGEAISFDLPAALGAHGFRLVRQIVYGAAPVARFTDQTLAALKSRRLDAVLLMSPRSAAHFAALAARHGVEDDVRHLTYCCMSDAIRAALAPLGALRIRVCASPTQNALLDLLETLNGA